MPRESRAHQLQQGPVERSQSQRNFASLQFRPACIETDAATRMIQRMADKDKSDYAASRQKLMDMLGGIPLGRPNRPDEVAELVAFSHLTELPPSPAAEFVIDGGTIPTI